MRTARAAMAARVRTSAQPCPDMKQTEKGLPVLEALRARSEASCLLLDGDGHVHVRVDGAGDGESARIGERVGLAVAGVELHSTGGVELGWALWVGHAGLGLAQAENVRAAAIGRILE